MAEGTTTPSGSKIDALRPEHLDELAQLHRRAFPGFFLSDLGEPFLRAYYRLVLSHPTGILLGHREAGELDGFVAGFLDPPRFYRSLRRSRVRLVIPILKGLIRRPLLLRRLLRNVRSTATRSARVASSSLECELSSIAVSPTSSGRGVGGVLMEAFLARAHELGASVVILTTDAQDNDATNQFYLKHGFRRTRSFTSGPRRSMFEYQRDLIDQSSREDAASSGSAIPRAD